MSSLLKTYLNPSSLATKDPKIPDGSRLYTMGSHYRMQFVPAGTDFLFILYPGFTTTCWCKHENGRNVTYPGLEAVSQNSSSIAGKWYTEDATTKFWTRPYSTQRAFTTVQSPMTAENNNGTYDFNAGSALEAWRMVSVGLKLRLNTSNRANEGRWEAIRIGHTHLADSKVKTNGINVHLGHVPVFKPLELNNWQNDPTYSSGRIKDLGQKQFILATEGNMHPWTLWPHNEGGSDLILNNALNQYSTLYDQNFDVIAIRLKSAEPISLIADCYCNMEETYRPEDPLNRFQTLAPHAMPSVVQKAVNMKRRMCRKAASRV